VEDQFNRAVVNSITFDGSPILVQSVGWGELLILKVRP
jgi:hypothetical protein